MKFIIGTVLSAVLAQQVLTGIGSTTETRTIQLPTRSHTTNAEITSASRYQPSSASAENTRVLNTHELTPQLGRIAKKILNTYGGSEYGTTYRFEHGGRTYFGRIERHYHPPGGQKRPWGNHKGVTLYTLN